MMYLDGEPDSQNEEFTDEELGMEVRYGYTSCLDCGKTLSFMYFEGDRENWEMSKTRVHKKHQDESPECKRDIPEPEFFETREDARELLRELGLDRPV